MGGGHMVGHDEAMSMPALLLHLSLPPHSRGMLVGSTRLRVEWGMGELFPATNLGRGGSEMTIWDWLLVVGCVLLWTACVLWVARLLGMWKRQDHYWRIWLRQVAEETRAQRKWGVDTW